MHLSDLLKACYLNENYRGTIYIYKSMIRITFMGLQIITPNLNQNLMDYICLLNKISLNFLLSMFKYYFQKLNQGIVQVQSGFNNDVDRYACTMYCWYLLCRISMNMHVEDTSRP